MSPTKAESFFYKRKKKIRTITALLTQNPVLSQKAVALQRPLDTDSTSCIIQERNSEYAVPLYLFLVIHHFNIMKRIAI